MESSPGAPSCPTLAAVDSPDVSAVSAAIAGLYPDSLLVGYVVVAEWVDPDGSRELSRHSGPDEPPEYDVRKWLAEGQDWPEDDDGDD